MLDVARQRPGGELVRWVEGDASAVDGPPADLAILTGHVAQVINDERMWRGTLAATRNALRRGGHVAYSRNPDAHEWLTWTPEATQRRLEAGALGAVDIWWQLTAVRGDRVRYEIHHRFASDGKDLVSFNELRFRTRARLVESLIDARFSVRDVFGEWNRAPVKPSSRELIFVATRD